MWDRKTGYYIYKQTLKSTKSKKKALKKAELFYRIFGLFFSSFAILCGLLVLRWGYDNEETEIEDKET